MKKIKYKLISDSNSLWRIRSGLVIRKERNDSINQYCVFAMILQESIITEVRPYNAEYNFAFHDFTKIKFGNLNKKIENIIFNILDFEYKVNKRCW